MTDDETQAGEYISIYLLVFCAILQLHWLFLILQVILLECIVVKQKIPSAATLGHKASPGFDLK